MSEPSELRPARLAPVALRQVTERLGSFTTAWGWSAPGGEPAAVACTGITLDSRSVQPGDIYAALPGAHTHGARFVAQALERGAVAVLTDPSGAELIEPAWREGREPELVPVLVVDDPRAQLGAVSALVYGEPARELSMIGVTGTNGKTTTAYLVEAALRDAGRSTGLIGTVETRIGAERVISVRTTPEAPDLHALLALMRQRGVTDVVVEVSSHALVLGRVDGIVFDVAAFTNLSHDHLDFHHDLDSYFQAKAQLFTSRRSRAAVVCTDDSHGRRLAEQVRTAGQVPLTTVATSSPNAAIGTSTADDPSSHWMIGNVRASRPPGTMVATLRGHHSGVAGSYPVQLDLHSPLPATFNVTNAALALVCAVEVGIEPGTAAAGIASCAGVPGRMERVVGKGVGTDRGALDEDSAPVGVVDYAHSPEAIATVLRSLQESTPGRLVVVLGAGGDRDRDKRPLMGAAAAEYGAVVVVTDDNPRSEPAELIRAAVRTGAEDTATRTGATVLDVASRRGAIATAVSRAGPGDIVVVVGKGHEQGQEVAGVVHPFDDRAALAAALSGEDEAGQR